MLERQLVLVHLTQNGADVQMDISWVQDLKAVIDTLLAEVEIVILNLESLLEVAKSRSELLGSSEDTSEVVVSNGSILVTFLGKGFSLSEKFKCDVKVLFLKEAHAQNIANNGSFLT